MAIEIVDFPIGNGGSVHNYVSHYQRVIAMQNMQTENTVVRTVRYTHIHMYTHILFIIIGDHRYDHG